MLQTFKNAELFSLGVPDNKNQPVPLNELLDLKHIPARVQIRLVRLVKLISGEVTNLLQTRNKYIRLYGDDQGNGNFTITGPNDQGIPLSPNWDKYKQEMEDLLAQTTKLDFEKVVLPANVDISNKLLLDFEAFLEIEEDFSDNGRNTEPVLLKRVE